MSSRLSCWLDGHQWGPVGTRTYNDVFDNLWRHRSSLGRAAVVSADSAARRARSLWLEVNGWQGAMSLTCDHDLTTAVCPNCAHPLDSHSVDLGCHVGWARGEGCECPLTLALQHNPKREKEVSAR